MPVVPTGAPWPWGVVQPPVVGEGVSTTSELNFSFPAAFCLEMCPKFSDLEEKSTT